MKQFKKFLSSLMVVFMFVYQMAPAFAREEEHDPHMYQVPQEFLDFLHDVGAEDFKDLPHDQVFQYYDLFREANPEFIDVGIWFDADNEYFLDQPGFQGVPILTGPINQSFNDVQSVGIEQKNNLNSKVEESSGTFTYNYPFTLPSGRNGMEPQLALSYNSNNTVNDSIVGYGWSLDIPVIYRQVEEGIEQLYTQNSFSSSISGMLEPIAIDASGYGTYGARTEGGSFLLYTRLSGDYWTVQDRAGRVYTFGSSSASKEVNPQNSEVYSWQLESVIDQNNNSVTYSYVTVDGRLYPASILYTGHPQQPAMFEVVFNLEAVPASMKMYNRGYELETTRRISGIEVYANSTLKYDYDLNYIAGDNGYRSMLQSVTKTGFDGGASLIMPATTFDYSVSTPTWTNQTTGFDVPEPIVNNSSDMGVRFGDFNGDSYIDLMRAHTPSSSNLFTLSTNNLDNTGWTTDLSIPSLPFSFTNGSADFGARLLDVNGDGYTDIVQSRSGYNSNTLAEEVYINDADGNFTWTVDSNYTIPMPFAGYSGAGFGVYITDVNADSLPDIVRSMSTYTTVSNPIEEVHINQGDGTGWQLDTNYDISLSNGFFYASNGMIDNGSRLADINGDSLPDIVQSRIYGNNVLSEVHINQGNGLGWAPDTNYTVPLPNGFTNGNYDMGARLIDVNHDGLVDLLHARMLSNGGVESYVYINKGDGTGWVEDTTYQTTVPLSLVNLLPRDYGTRFIDVDGDGLQDLVHRSGAAGTTQYYNRDGVMPDKLISVTESGGAQVNVEYMMSAEYKDSNGDLLNPNLPYNQMTVSSITVDAGLGNSYTTNYIYEGGSYYYQDPYDKKLAGFNIVTVTEDDGSYSKLYFHQGDGTDSSLGEFNDHFAKIGRKYRTENYDSNGNLFDVIINKWEAVQLSTDRFFVKNTQTVSSQYDGDNDARSKATVAVYDDVTGNLLTQINYGEVNANNDGTFIDILSDDFTTEFTYITTSSPRLTSLSASEVMYDSSQNVIGATVNFYDNLPSGQALIGNTTMMRQLASGTLASPNFRDSTYTYDVYGNMVTYTDPTLNTISYTYDSQNLFIDTVSNSSYLLSDFDFDIATGQVVSVQDGNGSVKEYDYDPVGRQIEERVSSTTNASTLVTVRTHAYNDSVMPRLHSTVVNAGLGFATNLYNYFDALGRNVQSRSEMEGGNYSVIDKQYDNRSRVVYSSMPYEQGGTSYSGVNAQAPSSSTVYDVLDRPVSVTDGVGTVITSYDQWSHIVTDELGNSTTYFSDAFGNLVQVDQVLDGVSYSSNYEYSPQGYLTYVQDPLNNERSFTYNYLGDRLTVEDLHDPNDSTYGVWTYTYSPLGQLYSATAPSGETSIFEYDLFARPFTETTADGLKYEYAYDTSVNGLGKVATETTSEAVKTYQYNARGEVDSLTVVMDGVTYVTQYEYDNLSRVIQKTYPNGSVLLITYNVGGNIESLTLDSYSVLIDADYNASAQLTDALFGNSVLLSKTYEPGRNRIDTITATNNAGLMLQDLTYVYDNANNITQIIDASDLNTQKVYNFVYDDLYRLDRAYTTGAMTLAGDADYDYDYEYDILGNITLHPRHSNFEYNEVGFANPHALTAINGDALTYDENGNLLSYVGDTYDWVHHTLLRSINGGVGTSYYYYDATGTRIKKVNPAQNITHYFEDFVAEPLTGESELYVSFNGSKLFSLEQNSNGLTPTWHLSDHIGSTVVITDASSDWTIQRDYDPYGNDWFIESATGLFDDRYAFSDKERDEYTSLMYFEARYLNTDTTRFLSIDPVFLNPSQDWLMDPQMQNAYSYARNNPIGYVDIDGRFANPVKWFINKVAGAVASTAQQAKKDLFNPMRNPMISTVGNTLAAYLAYDTIDSVATNVETVTSETSSKNEKITAGVMLGAELVTSGKGKSASSVVRAIKQLDNVVDASRTISTRGFKLESVYTKYLKHGTEGFQSFDQYTSELRGIWEGGENILEYTRKNGQTLRFDIERGNFGVINADGSFGTMFRPSDGVEYFKNNVQRDLMR